jgi:hypothetical protein
MLGALAEVLETQREEASNVITPRKIRHQYPFNANEDLEEEGIDVIEMMASASNIQRQ